MRLIQFVKTNKERAIAQIIGGEAQELAGFTSIRDLALAAIKQKTGLKEQVSGLAIVAKHDYAAILKEKRILAPLDHPDAAHCLVTGTGLTHLGSADTRDKMHQQDVQHADEDVTDSKKMFQWGVKGGKPEKAGEAGVQPEWFYKGDGSIVVPPGGDLLIPSFADDGGEESEVAGLYIVGEDGAPYRIGFALGNEYSDHVMERKNYLYLAHSKLRSCSFGPELLVGDLPQHLVGTSSILRDNKVIWSKEFLSGEENMCHSINNLEYHHFKYKQFLQAGDIHVHFFGTATLSFADQIKTEPNDQFKIEIEAFGQPLINGLKTESAHFTMGEVKQL